MDLSGEVQPLEGRDSVRERGSGRRGGVGERVRNFRRGNGDSNSNFHCPAEQSKVHSGEHRSRKAVRITGEESPLMRQEKPMQGRKIGKQSSGKMAILLRGGFQAVSH